MTKTECILLIHKQLTGQLTSEEHVLLNTWEQENEQNKQFAMEVRQAWELSSTFQANVPYNSDHDLKRLMLRVHRDKVRGLDIPSFSRMRMLTTVLKYAASLVIVACLLYVIQKSLTPEGEIQVLTATTAVTRNLLPDSSIVLLNRNSQLHYDREFDQRQVHLTGEAFFDIKGDSERPFLISTEHATIRVMGTSFNVRAIKEEQRAVVVVISGVVEMITPHGLQLYRCNFQINRGLHFCFIAIEPLIEPANWQFSLVLQF